MRLNRFITILTFFHFVIAAEAQNKYFSKSASVSFVAPAYKSVSASSRTGVLLLDLTNGSIQFSVLLKSLEFQKAMMQEKFNDVIMETDKYPKAEFSGLIHQISTLNLNSKGIYHIDVSGKLTIHGITRDIQTQASFEVDQDGIHANSTFNINISDYKITNPEIGDGIIEITVRSKIERLK